MVHEVALWSWLPGWWMYRWTSGHGWKTWPCWARKGKRVLGVWLKRVLGGLLERVLGSGRESERVGVRGERTREQEERAEVSLIFTARPASPLYVTHRTKLLDPFVMSGNSVRVGAASLLGPIGGTVASGLISHATRFSPTIVNELKDALQRLFQTLQETVRPLEASIASPLCSLPGDLHHPHRVPPRS